VAQVGVDRGRGGGDRRRPRGTGRRPGGPPAPAADRPFPLQAGPVHSIPYCNGPCTAARQRARAARAAGGGNVRARATAAGSASVTAVTGERPLDARSARSRLNCIPPALRNSPTPARPRPPAVHRPPPPPSPPRCVPPSPSSPSWRFLVIVRCDRAARRPRPGLPGPHARRGHSDPVSVPRPRAPRRRPRPRTPPPAPAAAADAQSLDDVKTCTTVATTLNLTS
jgi:hypothetical protein